jgi:hypothetical protein
VEGNVTVGGQQHTCQSQDCSLGGTGITALGSFTFRTNGQNFTVTVPAVVDRPIKGTFGYGLDTIYANLQIPPGKLVLSFDFNPSYGLVPSHYSFTQGAFTTPMFPTPEPGPLGLMVAGMVGILGLALKRRLPATSNHDTARPGFRGVTLRESLAPRTERNRPGNDERQGAINRAEANAPHLLCQPDEHETILKHW